MALLEELPLFGGLFCGLEKKLHLFQPLLSVHEEAEESIQAGCCHVLPPLLSYESYACSHQEALRAPLKRRYTFAAHHRTQADTSEFFRAKRGERNDEERFKIMLFWRLVISLFASSQPQQINFCSFSSCLAAFLRRKCWISIIYYLKSGGRQMVWS